VHLLAVEAPFVSKWICIGTKGEVRNDRWPAPGQGSLRPKYPKPSPRHGVPPTSLHFSTHDRAPHGDEGDEKGHVEFHELQRGTKSRLFVSTSLQVPLPSAWPSDLRVRNLSEDV